MFLTGNKNSPILDFSLRTVLVVGASSGIGFEVANQIKHLGRNLIVAARRLALLEENFSTNTCIELDVTNKQSVELLLEKLNQLLYRCFFLEKTLFQDFFYKYKE